MSTSEEPDVTKDSTSSNEQKGGTVKKDIVMDEKQLIKAKESKYYELIDWLQKWGYKVIDRTKENKITDIQFQAEVQPILPYSSGLNTPFFLEFQHILCKK